MIHQVGEDGQICALCNLRIVLEGSAAKWPAYVFVQVDGPESRMVTPETEGETCRALFVRVANDVIDGRREGMAVVTKRIGPQLAQDTFVVSERTGVQTRRVVDVTFDGSEILEPPPGAVSRIIEKAATSWPRRERDADEYFEDADLLGKWNRG